LGPTWPQFACCLYIAAKISFQASWLATHPHGRHTTLPTELQGRPQNGETCPVCPYILFAGLLHIYLFNPAAETSPHCETLDPVWASTPSNRILYCQHQLHSNDVAVNCLNPLIMHALHPPLTNAPQIPTPAHANATCTAMPKANRPPHLAPQPDTALVDPGGSQRGSPRH
jgi:hypothetical protein